MNLSHFLSSMLSSTPFRFERDLPILSDMYDFSSAQDGIWEPADFLRRSSMATLITGLAPPPISSVESKN